MIKVKEQRNTGFLAIMMEERLPFSVKMEEAGSSRT